MSRVCSRCTVCIHLARRPDRGHPDVWIGEVSDRVGLSPRTIRHYDEIGLAVPSDRSPGGFRFYTDADVARLELVKALRPLDLSLSIGSVSRRRRWTRPGRRPTRSRWRRSPVGSPCTGCSPRAGWRRCVRRSRGWSGCRGRCGALRPQRGSVPQARVGEHVGPDGDGGCPRRPGLTCACGRGPQRWAGVISTLT